MHDRARYKATFWRALLAGAVLSTATLLVERQDRDWRAPRTRYRGWPTSVVYKGPGSSYRHKVFVRGAALNLVLWTLPIWLVLKGLRERRRRVQQERARAGLCPGCGYCLSGTIEPRCPECGHGLPFDGQEDRDSNPSSPRDRVQVVAMFGVACALLGALLVPPWKADAGMLSVSLGLLALGVVLACSSGLLLLFLAEAAEHPDDGT